MLSLTTREICCAYLGRLYIEVTNPPSPWVTVWHTDHDKDDPLKPGTLRASM